jgi:hypothetical protein
MYAYPEVVLWVRNPVGLAITCVYVTNSPLPAVEVLSKVTAPGVVTTTLPLTLSVDEMATGVVKVEMGTSVMVLVEVLVVVGFA